MVRKIVKNPFGYRIVHFRESYGRFIPVWYDAKIEIEGKNWTVTMFKKNCPGPTICCGAFNLAHPSAGSFEKESFFRLIKDILADAAKEEENDKKLLIG